MKTFKALSALLSYPETELFAALPEIRHALDGENMLPRAEQQAFLAAHPDLYEERCGVVRVRLREGMLDIASLGCPGYASAAMPDWDSRSEEHRLNSSHT